MEHLNREILARLVDGAASPAEAQHLEACETCAAELDALRDQTEALGTLPELMPPVGDWEVLEARLRSEGLVETPGLFRTLGLAHTPGWMRAAAAVLLFLGGTGTGVLLANGPATLERGSPALGSDVAFFAGAETVEDAASAVRVAERQYVSALARYRELMMSEGGAEPGVDPLSRYAALEHLWAASQAAVRQAPGDPYLNGLLASVLGEREATARLVSANAGRDNWF